MKNDLNNSKGFISEIHLLILYWDRQIERSSRDKMEGLAHSILCMLDGVSGSFVGNIHTLANEGDNFMLHEMFYDKD